VRAHARVGQDTKHVVRLLRPVVPFGAPVGALVLPLVLALLAACAQVPEIALSTEHGVVRAHTPADAAAMADLLERLKPQVLALLPGARDRPTEVWREPALQLEAVPEERARDAGVVALTELQSGRIRIGEAGGIGPDFLLAHELVHALMDESWDPLPAIMKEGLCDAIACRLAPEHAARARALRMFGARFAFGDQALDLAVTEPSFGGRLGVGITVSAPGIPRREPREALELAGHGVRLHGELRDEDVLYGYGLLLVERTIDRIGLAGLHALCLRAREEGRAVLPARWVLWAAALDDSPASWRAALAQAVGPRELVALAAHLEDGLAEAIVANLRYRYADFTADAFLEVAQATVGLRGSSAEVPLAELQPLAQRVQAAWDASEPPALRQGQTQVHTDRDGMHLGVFGRSEERDGCTLQWVRVAAEMLDDTLDVRVAVQDRSLMEAAQMEACLRFGTDAQGVYLSSTLPGGFAAYRVEVHGVVVADLAWCLNVELAQDEHGWTTITSRLDPSLQLDDAVLYGGGANVLVSQRALGGADGEQRFPLCIPLIR
jgi:hypothetical protein